MRSAASQFFVVWLIASAFLYSGAARADIGIVNGDFELDAADNAAPPSGWADLSDSASFWTGEPGETGNPTSGQAATAPGAGFGSWFLTTARQSAGVGAQPVDGELAQTVDLSGYSEGIDDGDRSLDVSFIWASNDHRDIGTVSIHFFGSADGTGTELDSHAVALDDSNGFEFVGWFEESVGGAVPTGTRSVTIRIQTSRTDGSETNLWFDNFSGEIDVTGPPDDPDADTDGDGLPDVYETKIIDFDPEDEISDLSHVAGPEDSTPTDFDGDGSSDDAEFAAGTDPTAPDSDADGFGDGYEATAGTDPLDGSDLPAVVPVNPRSLPVMAAEPGAETFSLVAGGVAAAIVHDEADATVVGLAADLLAGDLESMSGVRPAVTTNSNEVSGTAVLAGTVGRSPLIDGLIADGKLDVSGIRGNWECYHLAKVADPLPGVAEALVIAGSDRRGTAYGLGALGEALGVSPWTWWADVPAPERTAFHLTGIPFDSVPPSVRFRGIFINDEDWGLQEWAEKNFEAGQDDVKDIGPKTYAKIFELLLRLRANYCWPAMHPSTRAFHFYEDNKTVADDYAIVMGSSHAEPMLRNNVDEWQRFVNANGYSNNWNYSQNKAAIYDYWDTRAQEVAPFENVYTIGKRGIHDSGMVEGSSTADKAAWLNTIFADQRQILADRVRPDPSHVPQIFVPYKEVLSIYDSGMVDVPDDVTLVWPDDNHGYIRRLSNDAEQQRAGGGGVYYHLSYWGAPQDYLWLSSIPPSLIWEEMTKAWENRCHRLWVYNVGDIKPAEISLEFGLRLAWNVDAYGPESQMEWLEEWAAREFGGRRAGAIASLMNDYFLLNHRRKPEHMDWRDDEPGNMAPPVGSHYPLFSQIHEGDETAERLSEFELLRQRADAIYDVIPAELRDAFYQLAVYPVRGSDAMNRKFLHTERAHRALAQKRKTVAEHASLAAAAYNEISEETDRFNNELADGKWNEMMDWRPRGLDVFSLPAQPADPGAQAVGFGVAVEGRLQPVFTGDAESPTEVVLHAVDDGTLITPMQEATIEGRRCVWTPGSGGAVDAGDGGRASYTFTIPEDGTYSIKFEVRTPTADDDSWHISLDGAAPEIWNNLGVGGPAGWRWQTWKTVPLNAGNHSLVVHEREDGAAFAAIRITNDSATGDLGEDDRFGEFRLPEFNPITRRSFFIDLINTETDPLEWSATTDDPWIELSAASGSLDSETRIFASIDWDQLPADENLTSMIHVRHGTDTVEIPVSVWNPATPPVADFIEENGAVVMEAENPSASEAGTSASWVEVPNLGRGKGAMIVQPTTAPSLTTPETIAAGSPCLEYSFHLRTPGSHRIEATFLPALSLSTSRGRRYAVAVDDELPQIVSLSSESGSGSTWSRSVLRSEISGNSTHALATPGMHTLRVWMVDPGLVLDRLAIVIGSVPYSHDGLRETATDSREMLFVGEGETLLLDGPPSQFRRIVNHGTIELRSSDLSVTGDIVNFGTFRVIGSSALEFGGNLANFGALDTLSWQQTDLPDLPDFSDFGSLLDETGFRIERQWLDSGSFHVEVPGYAGHRYALQRNPSLEPTDWLPAGEEKVGAGAVGSPVPLAFDWPTDQPRMFFRVEIDGSE